MTRPHKFKPGRHICSMAHLVRFANAGGWVYHRHKPMHPGWVLSWSIHFAQHAIQRRHLRVALEVNP